MRLLRSTPGDKLTATSSRDPMPPIRVLCLIATVLPAASHAEPILIQAEAQTKAADCGGEAARVEGNRNVLTITGACRSLDLRGDANQVTIELRPGAMVHVEGQQNRVGYRIARGTQPPEVSVAGVDSIVFPAGESPAPPVKPAAPTPQPVAPLVVVPPIAVPPVTLPPVMPPTVAVPEVTVPGLPPSAPATGPVVIRGDDQQRAGACGGAAAVLEGDRGSYVLRGGCTALTVRGNLATVQVDLAPRARVIIEGDGTTVFWAPSEPGAPPLFTLHGDASRVVKVPRIPD